MQYLTAMRHAERQDEHGDLDRPFDTPISEKGKQVAINTKFPVKKTIASPFLRCADTAARSCGVIRWEGECKFNAGEVHLDARFCEVWHPKVVNPKVNTLDQVKLLSVEELQAAIEVPVVLHPSEHSLPSAEESRGMGGDADTRFKKAYVAIVAENPGVDLLVVSHGDAVSALANLVGKEVYEVNYCGWVTVGYEDGKWTYVGRNGVGIF
jgi:broad specificity phosphatase PhoE